MKPQPIAFITKEGGDWAIWEYRKVEENIFAVMFDDGSIFDRRVGWRSYTPERLKKLVALLHAEHLIATSLDETG